MQMLKPCPICKEPGQFYECDCRDERKTSVDTRPAAPVEGLETKGFLFQTLTEKGGWTSSYSRNDPSQGGLPYRAVEPLVTRSQAGAIIAAERVENTRLNKALDVTEKMYRLSMDDIIRLADERDALKAENAAKDDEIRKLKKLISSTHKNAIKHTDCEIDHCLICDGGLFVCADCGAAEIETEQRVCSGEALRAEKAEADNAAPTARVKELTEEKRTVRASLENNERHWKNRAQAFKTQLAAAHELLRPIAEIGTSDAPKGSLAHIPDEHVLMFNPRTHEPAVTVGTVRQARAALEGCSIVVNDYACNSS